MAYLHWWFLLAIALVVAALVDPPFFGITADWATVIVSTLGVIVAGVAAYYLRKTLAETQKTTKIINDQLLSNRAYLLCKSIKTEYVSVDEMFGNKKIQFLIDSEWENFGGSPAINVEFRPSVIDENGEENADIYFVCKDPVDSIIGQCQKVKFRMFVQIPKPEIFTEDRLTKYSQVVARLYGEYSDIHSRRFRVECGLSVHLIINPGAQTMVDATLVTIPPNNHEIMIQDSKKL